MLQRALLAPNGSQPWNQPLIVMKADFRPNCSPEIILATLTNLSFPKSEGAPQN